MNERIEIGYERGRKIQYQKDPEFEFYSLTEHVVWDNTARWLEIHKRISDGALFALQVESENEVLGFGEELIPIEFSDIQVTRRVWHEPGCSPKQNQPLVEDGFDLIKKLPTLL